MMNLNKHRRFARFLFWFAQIIGLFNGVSLILFLGGTLASELINNVISFREDYPIFIILLCELLVVISFILSWKRKRLGSVLILIFTVLVCVLWRKDGPEIIWFHLPLLISGLLLFFYSYYKEWILKKRL